MTKPFLILLFICVTIPVYGQHTIIPAERLSVQQGLTDQFVHCMIQDHTGFLWIGGGNGIYRYDGYQVIYYKQPPGCLDCLDFNQVYGIEEDPYGMLWIICQTGIFLFSPETETSHLLYCFGKDSLSSLIMADNMDLLMDTQGRMWATNGRGLLKFTCRNPVPIAEALKAQHAAENLHIEHITLSRDPDPEKNIAQKLFEDKQHNIWVGCRNGLYVLRNRDSLFYRMEIAPKSNTPARTFIWDIQQHNADTFWVINAHNYMMTNVRHALSKPLPDGSLINLASFSLPDQQTAYSLYKDRQNRLLVSSKEHVFRLTGMDRSGSLHFENLYMDVVEQNDFKTNKNIHCILEDRNGVLWTTNYFYGVIKLGVNRAQFVSHDRVIEAYFRNTDVNHLLKDSRGNLWIGVYDGGLYRIDAETQSVSIYGKTPPESWIICMKEISPDRLWIGLSGGIVEFNMATGQFKRPLSTGRASANLAKAEVYDILPVDDNIHLASTNGYYIYNLTNKRLSQFSFTKNDSAHDQRNRFLSPIRSAKGEIWVGTSYDGICTVTYDAETGRIMMKTLIQDTTLQKSHIRLRGRYRLHEDSQGDFWIACKTGLYLASTDKKVFQKCILFDDIEFPEIWSILQDNQQNLWLGTQYGLGRYSKLTGHAKVFAHEDGLPVTLHGYNTVFRDNQDNFYFGGIGGFYSFRPADIRLNDSMPNIVITDFSLFNRSVKIDPSQKGILNKSITFTHSIRLTHRQNDVSFEFAALDYSKPMENKYAYKLDGYQEEWIETDAGNRKATFTNLSPGHYVFHVRGSNSDGIWNDEGVKVILHIRKPWWGTHMAFIAYLLLLILCVWGFVRWRLWKINREKADLEQLVLNRTRMIEEQKNMLEQKNQLITELDQLKSRFFTNISHEFRTPLALIQSPAEELLAEKTFPGKQKSKLHMILRNANRLLDLVNQLLDISRMDSSKMKLELVLDDVMKFLQTVAEGFISIAESRHISYSFAFPAQGIVTWYDPDKLEKIMMNLLSNAFKFTPVGGTVELTAGIVSPEDHPAPFILECRVRDSGQGIPADSLDKIFDRFYQVETMIKPEGGGTGIGLSLARDMARLMHGDIYVESKPAQGSVFTLQCPLGKEHLDESEYMILDNCPASSFRNVPLPDAEEISIPEQEEGLIPGKPILLIVEDNRDIRIQLADNLSREYCLYESGDGLDGLKKSFEILPDLVITDLMMPGMSGIDYCQALKNDERTSHIPVIMLTAKASLEDKITGLQTGADDYLPKPFSMAELKARIANLIDQRKKLRERFSREITLEPGDISITPLDEKFLKRAIEMVEKHMQDERFDVPEFRSAMYMSRSTLFRKLHALTNQSPTEFIRTIRLKRAASLLKQQYGNASEVAMAVGFQNLSYFNKSFKKAFGASPAAYQRLQRD